MIFICQIHQNCLLEYENSFLKEELRSKQLVVEKLLHLLNSDKTNVQKPSEQSNIHKVNVTHRSNETNESLIPIRKSHQQHRLENTQIYTTMSIKKSYSDRRFYGKVCLI